MNSDGTPKEWSISINRVDNAAYHHDLCYSKHDNTKTRNEVCDKTMLGELNGIVNPTLRENIDKSIVGKLIKAKFNFGLRLPIKTNLKFTKELAEELYKTVTRNFQRRRVNVNSIDEIWAADLIDMHASSKDNNGIKYLLTVIDIFSKFVCIVRLKRKTGQEVANAFSSILKERRLSKMLIDKGGEFYNKDVQKLVELYSTESYEKSFVNERFNSIKKKMFKYFSAYNTPKNVDVLDLLVDQYNNTIHSSIKMPPKEPRRKENENKVWRNLYPEFGGKTLAPKFSM